jgi:WD40 repeat protein
MLNQETPNRLRPTVKWYRVFRLLLLAAWIAVWLPCWQRGAAQEIEPRLTREMKAGGRPRPLSLAISPDGKTLALAFSDGLSEGGVKLIDLLSGKEVRTLKHPDDRYCDLTHVAFSPDGKTIALGGCRGPGIGSDMLIRLFNVATGDQRFVLDTGGWSNVNEVVFAPDGKTLAVAGSDEDVVLWDLESRKIRKKLPGHLPSPCEIAFCREGKMLASSVSFEREIFLWDVATGRKLSTFKPKGLELSHSWRITFSPDDKILAVTPRALGTVIFLDPRTGQVKTILPETDLSKGGIMNLAFSSDGRMFATACEEAIQLWEVVTAKERATLRGQKRAISLAFSPDGRTLASGSAYGILKVWDLDADKKKSPDADALPSLWTDLQSSDAAPAYKAIRILTTFPSQSLPFLARHLSPAVAPPDPSSDKVKAWITDLDSDTFAVRQKATNELKKSGISAKAALNRALKVPSSLEARRRIEAILEQIERTRYVQELQQLRAVEVLEHIGTKEACALLEDLAKGIPEARLTQEAKASLARLKKRPIAKR